MTKHSLSIHIHETFGSLDDMLTKDEQKIVLNAYNAALKEALTYIQGALPEGYTPTQLSFGNPFYTAIGTERPDLDRYDPDRFGPHLFNISVDFIDGDSPKVAFRVDTVDPETGETRVIKNLVYRDPFLEDFLGMSKPAFILRSTDADKLADATRKAFRKTEAIKESSGFSIGPISAVTVKTDTGTYVAHGVSADGELSAGCGARGEDEFEIDPSYVCPFVEYWTDSDGNEVEETDELLDALCEVLAEPEFDELWKTDAYEGKAESAGYRVNVAFTPELPFGYGDQNFLFKGLDIVDEEFSFSTREEAESFAQDCANRMTARNQDLESDGLQDGEIRVYYTNQDTVDRMVRNAGKAYTALMDKPAFPVLVARIGITKE